MNEIEFFSQSKYIALPTKNNPKVYLAVDNKDIKKNSFKLYNPFSLKAKILKKIAFCFPYFNIIKKEKSKFVKHLESKLDKEFISSIYIATDNDKKIVQLQAENGIFGYLKIATSERGNKRVQNEMNAIELLQEGNSIKIIAKDSYNGFKFFIIKEIEGEVNYINNTTLLKILTTLKRGKYYTFDKHPRVKSIYLDLKRLNNEKYLKIFRELEKKQKLELVYEHGDFAPWNIIKQNENYTLFDFEYFVEDGIEYFDLIKYHYQIALLINKEKKENLIQNILEKINKKNSCEIFIIFLLKEIVLKKSENKDISKENEILDILVASIKTQLNQVLTETTVKCE